MRKTKIICTLGPSTQDEATIKKLIQGGMNAARFNFSHGTHESHRAFLTKLKRARDELGASVAAIMDTKGPEIRIKSFVEDQITLEVGQQFTLTTSNVKGDSTRVSVTYSDLHKVLSVGNSVMVDDGLIELEVESISGHNIHCVVKNGGVLSGKKSVNLPGLSVPLPAITEQDERDLKFACENDFDYVAMSFTRSAEDVRSVREVLNEYGGEHVRIIAKIENRQGVDNIDEILEAADAVMVARGDLGIEIPGHEVPVIQKEIIRKSVLAGKTVITATQMLDSMIRNPRPTRAEVSDVANAVFDGASCVMLSGETASGKYPLESLKMMVDVVTSTESSINYWNKFLTRRTKPSPTIDNAISRACCLTAMDLHAKAILTATNSGHTARMIAKNQPDCPIVALTVTERVRRHLALVWGVYPYLSGTVDSTDRLFSMTVDCAKKEGLVEPGDPVVITAGVPIGVARSTNLIKIQIVE